MVIRATDAPDTFGMEWIITGPVQQGTGVRTGNQFAATWTSVASAEGRHPGTATYAIGDDGRLTGTWRSDGADGPARRRSSPAPEPGRAPLRPLSHAITHPRW